MKAMAGVDMSPQLATVVIGADDVTRCRWATETGRDLTGYHDQEWGTPIHDEAMLFEALVVMYFENGLSWATVFDKRDNLRTAFHGFNPAAVGVMTCDDVERFDGRHLHHSQSAKDRSHAAQRPCSVEILTFPTGLATSTS
jgi:DNA-3-methyladenine glycosylase I